MALDELDRRLLVLLRENARASFTDLARQVGTSEGTVRARVKRLTETGVIRSFTIRTAGANIKALVEVAVASNVEASALGAAVRAWEGVEAVWEVTGEQDLVIVTDLANLGDLNAFIDRVRELPGVSATRSRLILREH